MIEEVRELTLANGLRIVHLKRDGLAAHMGYLIPAGTRDEDCEPEGLAHYLEHCLFKGTKKRKAYHILSRIDSVGGELNAYTSKEYTVVHASVLKNHFERALELITDITFSPSFPAKEVEREKDVILDEIDSYLDSPSEQIFDDFEEELFKNHPLGRNILGQAESVKALSIDNLRAHHKKYFASSQITLAIVSPFPFEKVLQWIERHTASIPVQGHTPTRKAPTPRPSFSKTIQGDYHQAHVMIGGLAYSVHNKQRRALNLLNNILGGPAMNSRLNLNISEKYGFAYNLDSNYTAYHDTGVFSVYLGTDKKSMNKAVTLIEKELKKLCTKELGTLQLHRAKQQIVGQIALSQESGANQLLGIGKSKMLFDKVETLEKVYQKIQLLTASDLLETANEIMDPNKLSFLAYTPR